MSFSYLKGIIMFKIGTFSSVDNEQEIQDNFVSESLFYGTVNVFEKYLKLIDFLSLKFKELNPNGSIQEVYFGYSPQEDKFLIGFDIIEDDYVKSAIFELKIVTEFFTKDYISAPKLYLTSFYYYLYKEIKLKYNDLIDIRLD